MKKLLLPLLSILLLTACKKDITKEKVAEDNGNVTAAKGPAEKIDVCHYNAVTNTWSTLNVPINALPAHLAHGDIVPDADDDGYTKVNPCGNGSQDDCNDDNAAINPGAEEICENNIDDNCNGQVDENCIPSVTICGKDWMLKNLDVETYRDGTPIPQVQDPTAWHGLTTGAWCYYNNDPAFGAIYGKLYNWYAVNDPRGLAPEGWHVLSDAEWSILSTCLGGESVAGGAMKETGNAHWLLPNTEATNSSGFTGLPGGYRHSFGGFGFIGNYGFFWSSTEDNTSLAWHRNLYYNYGFIARFSNDKHYGFSIRCVKD